MARVVGARLCVGGREVVVHLSLEGEVGALLNDCVSC